MKKSVLRTVVVALVCSHRLAFGAEVFETASRFTVKVKTSIETALRPDRKGTSFGTGFLVDRDRGWILTNAHVSGRSPAKIWISWQDGKEIEAQAHYIDPVLDLAVLQIPRTEIPSAAVPARLACESTSTIGQAVVTFGHPRLEFFRGTRGIVSGTTANLGDFRGEYLHIDAATNPGNSGGPLMDLGTGRVLGIMTCGKSDAQGMNYALSIWQACQVVDLLRKGVDPSPAEIPFSYLRSEQEPTEIKIANLSSRLQVGGLKLGDKILRVGGGRFSKLKNIAQLLHDLRGVQMPATLFVERDGQAVELSVPFHLKKKVTDRLGLRFSGLVLQLDNDDFTDDFRFDQPVVVTQVDQGTRAESEQFQSGDMIDLMCA